MCDLCKVSVAFDKTKNREMSSSQTITKKRKKIGKWLNNQVRFLQL